MSHLLVALIARSRQIHREGVSSLRFNALQCAAVLRPARWQLRRVRGASPCHREVDDAVRNDDSSVRGQAMSNMLSSNSLDGIDVSTRLIIHYAGASGRPSIGIDSDGSPQDLALGEVMLFVATTLRQMVNTNLDIGGRQIADRLKRVQSPAGFQEFIASRGEIEDLSEAGGRRFEASLRASGSSYDFRFHAKGFGFMSRKASAYAPTSVMDLLAFLGQKRRDNDEFMRAMRFAARKCVDLSFVPRYGRPALSVMNQHQYPLPIALEAMGYATSTSR